MFKEKFEEEEEDVEWVEFERERFERDGVGERDGEGEDSRELPRLGCAISLLLLSASAVVERVVGVSTSRERERRKRVSLNTIRANRYSLPLATLLNCADGFHILLREGTRLDCPQRVANRKEKGRRLLRVV